jgi:hypothetical protein
MTTTATTTLTWDDLVSREPRLMALRHAVGQETSRGNPHYCANAVWLGYAGRGGGYRNWMTSLVGWGSKHPDLVMRSADAYDLAYHVLYGLLPDCRECGCA